MDKTTTFSEILRFLRKQRGLTQQELAEQIGVSLETIVSYENGLRTPNARILVRLEEYFRLNGAQILGLQPINKEYDITTLRGIQV